MITLQEFLNKNKNVSSLTKKVAISKRISDENGNPFLFTIKGITASEYEEIRTKCTTINDSNKINFNSHKFSLDLILKCTVYPNFKDAESIKQVGVSDPNSYIQSVLLPGEIDKLSAKIAEFNGFGQDINELIEESKN